MRGRIAPIVAAALLAVVMPQSASAQLVRNILNDRALTQDLLERLLSVHEGIAENSQEDRVETELNQLKRPILDDLTWTEQNGYLLQVRAFVDVQGTVRLLSSPMRCGSAATPSDALTLCLAQPGVQQDAPEGLRYSASKSYFVWASRKRGAFPWSGQTIDYGIIPGDLSGQLWLDASAQVASARVVSEIRAARDREALTHAVAQAQRRMESSQQRARLAESLANVQALQDQARQIDRDLARSLERAARSNALGRQLDMMQGIISVAGAIGSVRSMLGPGEDTSGLDHLGSTAAVRGWLSDYSSRLESENQTRQNALNQALERQRIEREAIIRVLEQYNAPRFILH
ncbi:MAG: hypothetical protein EON87_14755 [Brevundimonas sp.]|nr:MAG: hypothetical protein EON87_14755 [Brevundimonas sp.]